MVPCFSDVACHSYFLCLELYWKVIFTKFALKFQNDFFSYSLFLYFSFISEFKKLPEFAAAHLKQPDYVDQAAVVKSFTLHMESTQKNHGINTSLAQRVEEILNADQDIGGFGITELV